MARRLSAFVLAFTLISPVVLSAGAASAQEAPPATGGWTDPPAPPERAPVPAPAPAPAEAAPDEATPAAPAPAPPVVVRPPSVPRADARSRAPRAPWPPRASRPTTPFVIGGGVGAVAGRFAHDRLVGKGFSGLGLMTHVSYAVSRSLSVGFELDAYRTGVEYVGDGQYGYEGADTPRQVSPAGGLRLTAGCTDCAPAREGGMLKSGPLNVLTLGPRLQYAPDPARGFFAAVSGGVTVLEGVLPNRTAGAVVAHGGYRLALSEQVGVALEVGASAHRFSSSTAAFGFGALQLQLRL